MARRAWVRLARRFGYDLSDPDLDWIEDHTPGPAPTWHAQRCWSGEREDGLPRIGLFGILTDDRDSRGLDRTLRSLRRQTYRRWTHWTIAGVTKKTVGEDPADLDCDYLGIMRSRRLSVAGKPCTSLPACSSTPPLAALTWLYCDEDHLAANGRTRREPVFKPAWSSRNDPGLPLHRPADRWRVAT